MLVARAVVAIKVETALLERVLISVADRSFTFNLLRRVVESVERVWFVARAQLLVPVIVLG